MDSFLPFLFPFVGFAIVCMFILARLNREQRILKNGTPAVARVKNMIKTNTFTDMSKYAQGRLFVAGGLVWDMFLEIEEPGKPNGGLNIYYKFDSGFVVPQPGELLNILIDKNDPDKILVVSKGK